MRKVQIKVSHLVAGALSGIITMLGFSSCRHTAKEAVKDSNEPVKMDEIMLMYGIPQASYRIVGTVTDSDGKPVEGADVIVRSNDGVQGYVTEDTLRTGKDGEYFSQRQSIITGDLRLVVDPKNATLEKDSVDLKVDDLMQGDKRFDFRLDKKK